ncbi:hypothetical protein BLOT_013088 [Blomia tropicalis]|nr:hypothetical protein BLOT_013088 [Blomia tropicalis]
MKALAFACLDWNEIFMDGLLNNNKSFLKISVSKSKGFYPKPKLQLHSYGQLANAMQSYGNCHKNTEY